MCKIINEKILKSKTFFTNDNSSHIYNILANIEQAKSNIVSRAKAQGGSFEGEQYKQMLTKVIHESLNRYLHTEVRKELVKKEQSMSVAPMLVAQPNSLRTTVMQQVQQSGLGLNGQEIENKVREMLSQLETKTMEDLSTKDYAYQKTFINEK